MLPGQILNNSLDSNLLPPNLLLLETIMKQSSVPFLASFRQKLFLSFGLKSISLNHVLNFPRRSMV